MSHKTFVQVSVLILVIMAFFAVPSNALAGGVCGGTFVIEPGETLEKIAATCGTTVSAITAANPGIGGVLSVGQVLTIPGSNYTGSSTPVPSTDTPGTTTVNNYYTTNNYYNYVPSGSTSSTSSTSSNGTYIVQRGDTFSGIASRFGLSLNALWAANPGIRNINLLYVGQTIYVPGSSGITIQPVPTEKSVPLSHGTAPKGTEYGDVTLSNKSKTEVYVSLQGTTKDGTEVINEYPVNGTMNVNVPAGWYVYVAWVGGQKFVGHFNLIGDWSASLTFFKDKVVVE